MPEALPRMYSDLAEWFHLLSAPEEYAEEAAFYFRVMHDALGDMPSSVLELGSGGGNNAVHYKDWVERAVLSDLSADMLALSRQINPELAHVHGDMRTVRVDGQFDAVFVHDAVSYLTSLDDVRAAMITAFVHCRPGGVILFAPDHVRENFADSTDHGGHDGADGRAMRFLEWTYDPDPSDQTYAADYAFVLHQPGQPPRAIQETHICGLFERSDWVRLLGEVGFEAVHVVPLEHSEVPEGSAEIFVARRPA
jgi:SAM-dependent methyltransferase